MLELSPPQPAALGDLLRLAFEPGPLPELLGRVLAELVRLPWLGVEPRGAIFLLDPARAALVLTAELGLPEPARRSCTEVRIGHCLCGRAVAANRVLVVGPAERAHAAGLCVSDHEPHGQYCIPIAAGDRRIGLLSLAVPPGHEPTAESAGFLHAVADVLAGIVERRRVEESLAASEERFDLAVRGTDAGIWDWDLRTNRVYFSERWKSMLGHAPDEVAASFEEWDRRLHPDDRVQAHETIRAYVAGQTPEYELEHRLRHRDGSYRWILARGVMVRDASGRPYRMVGSHLDITERRRLESSLRERQAQLLAVQKILDCILPSGPWSRDGVEMLGSSVAADYAQGDYFNALARPDGTLLAIIADVSGHGVDAALLMAMTHAWLHALAELPIGLDALAGRLNDWLCPQTEDDRFVTLMLLEIDPATRTLRHLGAGHPPTYHLDASGQLKGTLLSQSWPLALEAGGRFPASDPRPLEPGDLLLSMTDGICEARSPAGEAFGPERALAVVTPLAARPLPEILAALDAAVRAHTHPLAPTDDVTTLLIRVS